MDTRRNNFDVTNEIDTTDLESVSEEVSRIYQDLYPDASSQALARSFDDVGRLFRGEYPGYKACDTGYHNLQHTLDVSLAMARMMDGYERSRQHSDPIGSRLFTFGTAAALLHDVGYIRRQNDTRHQNGAEYTLKHVSRGAKFIEDYMGVIGLDELGPIAGQIVHFTGYERPINKIRVPGMMFRMLGNMLGTADIIAQMSDRCYLEKCRDHLYTEFVAGGLAQSKMHTAVKKALYTSAADLVSKTPMYYRLATDRLNNMLGNAYVYAEDHFGGQNLYLDEIDKNVDYASSIAEGRDLTLLRRTPPSVADDGEDTDLIQD